MKEICHRAVRLLLQGRMGVLATMIRQAGPSPRHLGTKCLILEDGSLVGTIGGGRLEAETLQAAGAVFKTGLPRCLSISLKGSDVAGTEMLCGGNVDIFLEPLCPEDASNAELFGNLLNLLNKTGTGLLATVVDEARWQPGLASRAFFEPGRDPVGRLGLGGRAEAALREELDGIVRKRKPVILSVPDEGRGTGTVLFLEPIVSDPVLYVFGAGHVSAQLVPLASRVGFQAVVIDDRPEFADVRVFPDAREVHVLPFDRVMDRLPVDPSSFIVIVTRGHIYDKDVLAQALKTKARYIGMIGSRRKRNIIYEGLREEGFTQADLGRVHSPIGVDIGAETPAEIGVSIVAELIRERAMGLKMED